MALLPQDPRVPEFGSQVGFWIVRERIGSGSHGVVFRAVRADKPDGKTYALKLALEAEDVRMERELWLLSRIRHPSVPRLESHGLWESPGGEIYPYLVMEWVEGLSLYKWAAEYGLTLRQAIEHLAQIARALEATHRYGVHRDVKGGNVRVSPEGRAVLLDFGSCRYPKARPLTRGGMPPGTDQYRSPQLHFLKYALRLGAEDDYRGDPADDVYALGVTAYRLLAGTYPPRGADPDDEQDLGEDVLLVAPKGLDDWCPELSALILRMLSEDPAARGSAKQVARELKRFLKPTNPVLDRTWIEGRLPPTEKDRRLVLPWCPQWGIAHGVALAGAAMGVLLWFLLTRDVGRREVAHVGQRDKPQVQENPDTDPVGLGDGTSASPLSYGGAAPSKKAITGEPLPDSPFPGQKRSPCNKQREAEIKGGCWIPLKGEAPPCTAGWYEYAERCYAPFYLSQRVPTSEDPP